MKRIFALIFCLFGLFATGAYATETTISLSSGEKVVINYSGRLEGVRLLEGSGSIVSIETTEPPLAEPSSQREVSRKAEKPSEPQSEKRATSGAPTKGEAKDSATGIKWSWARPKVED